MKTREIFPMAGIAWEANQWSNACMYVSVCVSVWGCVCMHVYMYLFMFVSEWRELRGKRIDDQNDCTHIIVCVCVCVFPMYIREYVHIYVWLSV